MPFVTTPEKVGHRRVMREGIHFGLKLKFGEAGLKLMPEIEEIHEEEKLRKILKTLESAATLEEVRGLWAQS